VTSKRVPRKQKTLLKTKLRNCKEKPRKNLLEMKAKEKIYQKTKTSPQTNRRKEI
jgi:hypothetical protein